MKMNWDKTAMPHVPGPMPLAKDYVLTTWGVSTVLILILVTDFPEMFTSEQALYLGNYGITFVIAEVWWIWRSFKGVVYFKQNPSLSFLQRFALVITNIFTYSLLFLIPYLYFIR